MSGSHAGPVSVAVPITPRTAGAPAVYLLCAEEGSNEAALRAAARAVTAAAGASFHSRSYRFPWGLATSHRQLVGVDVERVGEPDPRFLESILTPGELQRVSALGDPALDDAPLTYSLWSSKEALAKALGEPLRIDPRRLDSPAFWPAGRSGPWRAEQLQDLPEGHTGWLCWRV